MTGTILKDTLKARIESLDLLKGIIMVIMALDHIRDYFHYSAYQFDVYDLRKTTVLFFLTRWVTHLCAPAFSFLAGTSAFLSGRKNTAAETAGYLFKRGLWLVAVECIPVSFGWCFDPQFRFISLATIFSLGVSMIVLSGLVYFPRKYILAFGCAIVFGHNLFDNAHFGGNIIWVFLHDGFIYHLDAAHRLEILYPVIPWVGVMALGYSCGALFQPTVAPAYRRMVLGRLGFGAITLFIWLRSGNFYGDHIHWSIMGTITKTMLAFIRVEKYPPSLQYLLITLGPCLLFLAYAENFRGRLVGFFSTFGKVPFFYYLAHIYLLHILAALAAQLTGFGWKSMVLTSWVTDEPRLKGFGFSIVAVYLIWATVVGLLYPLCKWFAGYKFRHKNKKWLNYL